MQSRDLLKKLKSLGITVCKAVGPYLVLGGVATNIYILAAPKEMLETQTCENARRELGNNPSFLDILNAVMVMDTGIYIFNVTGTIRAVMIPSMHWAYEKVAKCLSSAPCLQEKHLESIKSHEHELISAISTGIFIKSLPLNSAITYSMLPIALLPLARQGIKHILPNYPGSASLPTYRQIFPNQPRLVNSLSTLESLSSGINLGGALSAVADFFVNAFYDSTHKNDWRYQTQLMYGMAALGFIAGAGSIFNERVHSISNHASNTMQIFYLICMPLISMTMCFYPSLEDTNTFMKKSIYIVMGITVFALLAAGVYTRLTSEHQQVAPEQDDNIHNSENDPLIIDASHTNSTLADYGKFFSAAPNNSDNQDVIIKIENPATNTAETDVKEDIETAIESDASDHDEDTPAHGSPKLGGT